MSTPKSKADFSPQPPPRSSSRNARSLSLTPRRSTTPGNSQKKDNGVFSTPMSTTRVENRPFSPEKRQISTEPNQQYKYRNSISIKRDYTPIAKSPRLDAAYLETHQKKNVTISSPSIYSSSNKRKEDNENLEKIRSEELSYVFEEEPRWSNLVELPSTLGWTDEQYSDADRSIASTVYESMNFLHALQKLDESRKMGIRAFLHVTPRFNVEIVKKFNFYDLVILESPGKPQSGIVWGRAGMYRIQKHSIS